MIEAELREIEQWWAGKRCDALDVAKALREAWARIDFLERRIADLGGIPTPAVLLEIEHEPGACETPVTDAGARDDRS